MGQGNRGRRWSPVAMVVMAALQGVALIAVAGAITVNPGVLGNFENEGNLVTDAPPRLDWATAPGVVRVIDETTPHDIGFRGSSKEEAPADWVCNFGGDDPPKDDLLRAYANARLSETSAFLDLAWVRQRGLGDAHISFEFNRAPSPAVGDVDRNEACPIVRQVGDFLVTYDFGGGDEPAEIRTWRWSGTVWIEHPIPHEAAAGATNTATVVDPLAGNAAIPPRAFGEVTLDLLQVLPAEMSSCPGGFAYVNVRSRSSHSITSALQDRLPTTAFNLSRCGTIGVEKVDTSDPALKLAGAVFRLLSPDGLTELGRCTTGVTGTCTFAPVLAGPTYLVEEVTPPPGYQADPTVRRPVRALLNQVASIRFLNSKIPPVVPRGVPVVEITKLVNGQDEVTVRPGAPLTYTLTIANDSTVPVTITSLTDTANGSPVTLPAACTGLIGTVLQPRPDPTSSVACTYQATAGSVDVHNVARVVGTYDNQTDDDQDDARVRVVDPNPLLAIEKLVNGRERVTVQPGDPLTYTLTISNAGDVPVTITSLIDVANGAPVALPAACTGLVGRVLAVGTGAASRATCTYSLSAGVFDITNTVTAQGRFEDKSTPPVRDTAQVIVVNPDIRIDKVVNGQKSTVAHQGDPLTYRLTITNTSNTALTITSLTDTIGGTEVLLSEECRNLVGRTLANRNDTLTCTYTRNAPADDVVNTAEVTARDPNDPLNRERRDTSQANVDVVHPRIAIDKLVNGSERVRVPVGTTVTYTLRVTNTGDVALTVTGLTDVANQQAVTLPPACLANVGPNSTLAVGASFTCEYRLAITADTDNVVTVTATDKLPGGNVTANDRARVDTFVPGQPNPAVTLDKLVNGQPSVVVRQGDPLVYTIRVTNTGDTDLNVTRIRDVANGQPVTLPATCGTGSQATLRPGDSFTCEYRTTAGADDVANVARVDAIPPGGTTPITSQDTANVDVIHPVIRVVKSGPAQAHGGDRVRYTFAVTNTGDVPLTNVRVTDDVIGDIGTIAGLAVDETVTLVKDFTLPANATADITNVATAVGVDPLGRQVQAVDDHVVDLINPAIEVIKTANDTSVSIGDTVTFTYEVRNIGDTPLTDIVVTDDVLGEIGRIARLEPGRSRSLTRTITVAAGTPLRNVGTATGTDPLGRAVTDTDDENLTIVGGVTFERPETPARQQVAGTQTDRPPLAKTGLDLAALAALGGLLTMGGTGLVRRGRRRDDDDTIRIKDRLAGF